MQARHFPDQIETEAAAAFAGIGAGQGVEALEQAR
jgi:hypothetical protein